MKKNLWKLTVLTAIIIFAALIMSGAADNGHKNTTTELLEKRWVIMENILEGGISFDEGIAILGEVEGGMLLKEDTCSLEGYKNTDYEKTLGMNILSIDETGCLYDRHKYVSEIQWTMLTYEGIKTNTYTYDITVKGNNNDFRLISFEMQE